MDYLHPPHDPRAMQQVLSMGEVAYIAMRKRQAVDYIREDCARFAKLSLQEILLLLGRPTQENQNWWLTQAKNSLFLASSLLVFWGLGRALRQRKAGSWLLLWLWSCCIPRSTTSSIAIPRYRCPIEPEMAILCVFLITEAARRLTSPPPDRSSARESRSIWCRALH